MSGRPSPGRIVLAALVAYPFVELVVMIAVASVIGWWWVLVVLVVGAVLGSLVVRYAIAATGRSLTSAMSALREAEARPAVEGPVGQAAVPPPAQTLLLVPAGALIAVPGFLTDIAGMILLLPVVRRYAAGRLERRLRGGASG
ncbi:MAG: FxsA family protein [Candidatus Nanopelagicales bacterium]